MYRTYSVNDMPQPVQKKPEAVPITKPRTQPKPPTQQTVKGMNDDDLILLLVILLLVMNNCDDKLLLLALLYVFLSGYMSK